ncbi:hypothetical protein [Roseobacter litoralis]|uniref:Transmembrane protein n=1 Tax=Roseobacter litoralis (strain ATCC 49566 / DSM 6996 / JCM 21268 / NBRC 15278 / OCh 149) TaxID=391595 RepID=F7ZJ72_ROSLO|nr:hypothetical protein [Roseobacter litoralis]AEI96317.1 hypothetical protein RLO149_c044300 [Roseobacter litoralis Och 149]
MDKLPNPMRQPAQAGNVLLPVAMIVIVSIIVLAPELVPAYLGRDGQIWTPFNSSNYRLGDMYFYAPMIQQVAEGNIPPLPANQLPDGVTSSPEELRWMSYAVAAIPALFFSDPRIPLLWAIWLPCVLNFLFAFVIYRSLRGKVVAAVLVGILVTFYFQFWRAIPVGTLSMSLSGIDDWISLADRRLDRALDNAKDPYDYYSYSDMFRFLMPAMSFAFLTVFLALLIQVDRHRSKALSALATVAACLMAFTYPPHALFAYLLLVGFSAIHLLTREWRGFRHFLYIGLVTLAFLLATGVPQTFLSAFDETTFISAVYSANGSLLANVKLSAVPGTLMNKYLFSFLIALWLVWGNAVLRRFILVTGFAALLVSLSSLLPPLYADRFLYRGIDHIWFMVLVTVCFLRLEKRSVAQTKQPPTSAFRQKVSRWKQPLFIAGALLLPVVGFSSLLERNLTDERRFVPAGQWAAYNWLRENADRETVVALNWADAEFIAVYLAQVRTVFSSADLANRRPEAEVARFVATWKTFGLPRETFESWVRRSLETERDRRSSIRAQRSTPLLSEDDYYASRIALALIYFPYVRQFDGALIAGTGEDQWSVTEEFVEKMLAVFDQTPVDDFLEKQGIQTLIVSSFEEKLMAENALANWQLVWQSKERRIYRQNSTSTP